MRTMRVTSKGQVTIPAEFREKAGIFPNTQVSFAFEGKGKLSLVRAPKKANVKSRGDMLIEHLKKQPRIKMTTEEIMKLTRG